MMSTTLSPGRINDEVLAATSPPRMGYYAVVGLLGLGILWLFTAWVYQAKSGMGVAGISHPINWGVYIGNFVFWVGIAHSGTLISAVLHLLRARWRTAVSRSAEAMTVFAVMTAGLFPLVHLGRVWVFYYIIPYPSQRQLWPNFTSPLVWDVLAITTYLIASSIFFYVGLIPDAAAARDRWVAAAGPEHPRSRLYRLLALGWHGTTEQWRHHSRAYLFFAALATPLVVSVHSVVSWDFAVSLLPGWHNTIFPPYFVAGAIHSGLAMVLTLLIPMRLLLGLQRAIPQPTLSAVASTMIVTALIVGYAYVVEPAFAWYSGNIFEIQFAHWRMTGWMALTYWALIPLNVLVPLLFVFRRVRRSVAAMLVISVLVNVGMWLERYFIVVGSTARDFLPHNWGRYSPTWVEISITVGSFAFFLFWFFLFARLLPPVAIADVKREHFGGEDEADEENAVFNRPTPAPPTGQGGVLAIFTNAESFVRAVGKAVAASVGGVQTFAPFRVFAAEQLLGRGASPVRYWTLVGVLAGIVGGFALAGGTAAVNDLIVGGKYTSRAWIAYCIVAFEGAILLGTLANFAGMIVHSRLGCGVLSPPPPAYDPRFSVDRFGLLISCPPERRQVVRDLLDETGPEDVRVID